MNLPSLTAQLKNWEFDRHRNVFWGRIFNDAKHRFRDGTYIHTSFVVKEEEIEDAYIVYTLNSIYFLRKEDRKGHNDGATSERNLDT